MVPSLLLYGVKVEANTITSSLSGNYAALRRDEVLSELTPYSWDRGEERRFYAAENPLQITIIEDRPSSSWAWEETRYELIDGRQT